MGKWKCLWCSKVLEGESFMDLVKASMKEEGGLIHSGSNEVTLQYPGDLIDTGEFRICIRSNNYDELACGTGYNSEAKQPEHVFINLFVEENRNSPDVDVDNQAQSQSQDNEQSQSQNNNQEQTTTIINCPPDSRCVIEQ